MCQLKAITEVDGRVILIDNKYTCDSSLFQAGVPEEELEEVSKSILDECPMLVDIQADLEAVGWNVYDTVSRGLLIIEPLRAHNHRVIRMHNSTQEDCTYSLIESRTDYLSGDGCLKARWLEFHLPQEYFPEKAINTWMQDPNYHTSITLPEQTDETSNMHGPFTIKELKTDSYIDCDLQVAIQSLQSAFDRNGYGVKYWMNRLESIPATSVHRLGPTLGYGKDLLDFEEFAILSKDTCTLYILQVLEIWVSSDRAKHLWSSEQGIQTWNQWLKDNPDLLNEYRHTNGHEKFDSLLRGTHCIGMTMKGVNLSGFIFGRLDEHTMRDVSDKGLEYASKWGASFRDCDLSDCSFANSNVSLTNFSNSTLVGANLSGGRFDFSQFDNADLRNADLRGADLRRAFLNGADLRGAKFEGALMPALPHSMARVNLQGCDLSGATINGADLREANLKDTVFPKEVNKATFGTYENTEDPVQGERTSPQGAVFDNATLTDCEFRDINSAISAEGATLVSCQLTGTLSGSDLSGTKFRDMSIQSVEVEGCRRSPYDRPITRTEVLEVVLLLLSPEALAALTITSIRTLGSSYKQAFTISAILALVYLVYLIPQIWRFLTKEGPRPQIPNGVLGLLCIDSILAIAQLLSDPDFTRPTEFYLAIVWIGAILTSVLMTLISVGLPSGRLEKAWCTVVNFGRTLIWFPVTYTVLYGLIRPSSVALQLSALAFVLVVIFDFKYWLNLGKLLLGKKDSRSDYSKIRSNSN